MLAAIGQLAAVFVGIPSLIYLAVQIRAQNKDRQHTAVHALTEQWGDITRSLHDGSKMAEIFLRGVHSFSDLDPIAKVRFSAFFNRLLTFWQAIERTIEDMISNRGVHEWWQTRKRWHTTEFAQVVDQMIADAGPATAFTHYNLNELPTHPSERPSSG